MKLVVHYRQHQPSRSFLAALREQLEPIGKLRQIDEARATAEHHEEQSPPFRVTLHLVTPGPDLFGEAIDHTLGAALRKAVGQIESQLTQREQKRERRLRGQPLRSAPAIAGRAA